MYFPIAELHLNPAWPILIGLGVSVFSSPTGISGGFLILPICVNYLGFSSAAVSPTNFIFNIMAMPTGLWLMARQKRLLWSLGGVLIIGSLPGIVAGMVLRNSWLKEADDFKIFLALVLTALALNLARSLKKGGRAEKRAERTFQARQKLCYAPERIETNYNRGYLSLNFCGEDFSVFIPSVIGISILVGLAGGIYGIGGAAIIAPILISHFRLPIYIINGASMLAGWAAAIFGLVSYIFIWPVISGQPPVMPDFKLGFLFGLGGMAGVYIGSALQRFLPSKPIKIMMIFLIGGLAVQSFGLF